MTYYDELGISAEATAEEIRQAHRRLVKLLHPDQQQDAELRKLADLQLMRVNSLVEELLDPQRRALYNHKLTEPLLAVVPVSPAVTPSRWRILAWLLQREWKLVLLGSAGIFLLVFASAKSPTDSVRSVPVVRGPSLPPQQHQPQVKPTQRPLAQRPVSQRNPSQESVEDGREEKLPDHAPQPSHSEAPAPAIEPPTPVASRANGATEPKPAVDASKRPSFAGTWLYAGPTSLKAGSDSLRYRPEYIELRITEDGSGGVRGDYRSRYTVTDLAISPSVDFAFGGDPAGPPMRWVSRNGAIGNVALKLLQPDLLQVDWQVNDGSSGRMDLVRGSAKLVRKF
jgi:hypothetical protein